MISIETVVNFVLAIVIGGIVFGLLYGLLVWLEKQYPESGPFFKIGRVVLMVLAVFVLIGIILGLAGHQVFRWGP